MWDTEFRVTLILSDLNIRSIMTLFPNQVWGYLNLRGTLSQSNSVEVHSFPHDPLHSCLPCVLTPACPPKRLWINLSFWSTKPSATIVCKDEVPLWDIQTNPPLSRKVLPQKMKLHITLFICFLNFLKIHFSSTFIYHSTKLFFRVNSPFPGWMTPLSLSSHSLFIF